MIYQTATKQLEDLTRVTNHLKKSKKSTGAIVDVLTKYGKIDIRNDFTGYALHFKIHSKVLQNGIKGHSVYTSFQQNKNDIKNNFHPVLLVLLKDVIKKNEKRINELQLVINKQLKK